MEEQDIKELKKPRLVVRLLFFAVFFLISLFMLFIGLKLVDKYFQKTGQQGDTAFVYGDNQEYPWVISYELYPYTGHHAQAYYHAKGKVPYWGYYDDYDFETGDYGFTTIDINFDNPPSKARNEFRIIMIGGSAAWGEGARTNSDMHFKQLENNLNQEFKDKNVYIRVINMGMSGSMTYQNFISLNRWGHILEPDLILSFSGRNDLWVPFVYESQTDLPHKFENVLGVVEAAKHYNSPGWLKILGRWFPGLILRTNLGTAIRMMNLSHYTTNAMSRYKNNKNTNCLTINVTEVKDKKESLTHNACYPKNMHVKGENYEFTIQKGVS